MSNPTFSLCHATARLPSGWKPAHDDWMAHADNPEAIEYILAVDSADITQVTAEPPIILVENKGRQCCVDAWNLAAAHSTGKVIITVADDIYTPPHWDTELLKVLGNLTNEKVAEVKSGTSPMDDEWMRCLFISILTRSYYNRYGYVFHPKFESMYCDVWFTEQARSDEVVVDARHLTFQHKHWIGTTVPYDEVYQKQDSRERMDRGLIILGDVRGERCNKEGHS